MKVKLLYLLERRRRLQCLLLLFIGAVVSVLDALAAVLVFSILQSLSQEQALALPVVGPLDGALPGLDGDQLLIGGAMLILGVFLLRSVVYMGQVYIQQRVANNAGVELSQRLLRGYLALPYAFHLSRNSAELIRNAYDSVQRLIGEVLIPAIRVFSEVFIVIAILVTLVAAAPVPTGIVIVLFVPVVWVLLRTINPRLQRLGRQQQDMARASLQSLQQALAGLRDVKLLHREEHFLRQFVRQRARLARARYLRGTAAELPRATLESFLATVVATLLAFSVLVDGSAEEALPMLGLFGYAAFRVLPSLTKILQQMAFLRFAGPTIDDIYADLRFFESASAPAVSPADPSRPTASDVAPLNAAIELVEVSYRYPEAPSEALVDISLRIPRGITLGIVGATGSGKTTLIDIMTGLLRPTSGRVLVDGEDVILNTVSYHRRLGVVPQAPFLMDDSLRRNVAFGVPDGGIDDELVWAALRNAQLEDFVKSLPGGLDAILGERGIRMSGGQRQRVAIARALYHQPDVLVFDEATSALDSVTEGEFLARLRQLLSDRTLIMVAHRISTIKSCDQIVFMARGSIGGTGTYLELLQNSAGFRSLATGT